MVIKAGQKAISCYMRCGTTTRKEMKNRPTLREIKTVKILTTFALVLGSSYGITALTSQLHRFLGKYKLNTLNLSKLQKHYKNGYHINIAQKSLNKRYVSNEAIKLWKTLLCRSLNMEACPQLYAFSVSIL